MRVLVLDDEAKTEIARVLEYAEAHRMTIQEMHARIAVPDVSVGDDPNHVCYIKDGFKCVLSIEQQPAPLNWCKHLSVSVANIDRVPNIPAVELLMKEFGMNRPLKDCHVYMEESVPKSVNVICPI